MTTRELMVCTLLVIGAMMFGWSLNNMQMMNSLELDPREIDATVVACSNMCVAVASDVVRIAKAHDGLLKTLKDWGTKAENMGANQKKIADELMQQRKVIRAMALGTLVVETNAPVGKVEAKEKVNE